MVYRGKPSAGCDPCRKAKKRCTLEQPACARCVKLKKGCSGYRDTTALQIQDESEAVKRKATKQKVRQENNREPAAISSVNFLQTPPCREQTASVGIPTPATTNSDSASSDDTIDIYMQDYADPEIGSLFSESERCPGLGRSMELIPHSRSPSPGPFDYKMRPSGTGLPFMLLPSADDVASTHFFKEFTSNGHWDFLRTFNRKSQMDPCLDLAIRACGMAALHNVESVSIGRDYARSMYVEALGLLNTALRDPVRCKTDESLIAVAMLGYYENLTCDSKESIQSWKAHIAGATQLLRLRGKQQFRTSTGRMLFRETRAQILIHCIWDDLEPPSFLMDWDEELEKQSIEIAVAQPADKLIRSCFSFAHLRAKVEKGTIANDAALAECNEIDRRMIQWSIDAAGVGGAWRWSSEEVPDSPNVWNGTCMSYTAHPGPTVWNTFRSMRILVTRTQEHLCHQLGHLFSDQEIREQRNYFRKVRRQMTDEICAGLPPCLGHAPSPLYNSPSVLVSAYGSIWPLFFAGTCALERLGSTQWESFRDPPTAVSIPSTASTSAAAAQAAWILGRLEYISSNVGLRWATGVAGVLKGDFRLYNDMPTTTTSNDRLDKVMRNNTGRLTPQGAIEAGVMPEIYPYAHMALGSAIAANAKEGMHKPAGFLSSANIVAPRPALASPMGGQKLKWVSDSTEHENLPPLAGMKKQMAVWQDEALNGSL